MDEVKATGSPVETVSTAEQSIPDRKTDELNENLVEMIEPLSVQKETLDERVAENKVLVEQKTVVVNESTSEDIVCDKFKNQMQIKVEPSNEDKSKAPLTTAEPPPFDAELMEVESIPIVQQPSTELQTKDIIKMIAPPPLHIEKPIVERISEQIESIAIDVKSKPDANTTPRKLERRQNVVATTSRMVDIKSEIKFEENVQPKQNDEKCKSETDAIGVSNDSSKDASAAAEDTSIRRSGRIRTINKTKQRAQGLGLVKDKKRTPFVVDEDSSSVSFDMSTDNIQEKDAIQQIIESKPRIKSEEQLEKEKIDRENGLKLFVPIIDNEYRSERTISKEAKKMTCDCFLTHSEFERGEMGCGEDCLNRMLLIECGPKCVVGDRCTNRRFQKHRNSSCNIFKTEKKGYGLIATDFIPPGQFIMEYVGEVLNSKQFEKRANDYSKQMNAHYYFMALSSDCVIDATKKGNISRFINHSCDPNAETQKWTVNGELRIGFFSKKQIMPDEEITFDYQFQRYGYDDMVFDFSHFPFSIFDRKIRTICFILYLFTEKRHKNAIANQSIAVDGSVVNPNPKKNLSLMMTMRVKMKRLEKMIVNCQQNQKLLLLQMNQSKRR